MIETLERPKEKIGSDAFRIEYGQDISKNVLVDDIVSYLGEYRFKLPKYHYTLDFADGQIIDPNRRESMEEMSQRAIDLKNSQGKSSVRESAEKIGFQKLDQQLRLAKTGDSIIWMSPMGSEADGYGDYGFVFLGQINGDGHEKKISMTAIRIEHPTIDQFNKINEALTQEKITYQNPEEFLANPKVLEYIAEDYLDSILKKTFSFDSNEKIQKMFKQVMSRVSSMISDLADLLMNPWKSKEEKIKGLNSLENYVLKLKNEYEILPWEKIIYEKKQRISDIVGDYGHKPPVVAGSCGSTGNKDGFSTSNLFAKGSGLNSILSEQEWFTCPKCGYKADGPVGNTCPKDKGGCGLTKEAYAKESGVSCD